MSGLLPRRLLLAAAVLLQLVAWQPVSSSSIVTLYNLADCSDDNGGLDSGVESDYVGQFDPSNTVYHSMNLTGRTCLPLYVGPATDGQNGTALYDCQYDPYTALSTIIVLSWGINVNPTCNTSRAFLQQHNTFLGSYIQHTGFVNGQCTMLQEGLFGFNNFAGVDLPVYARINCSAMIPGYEQVRQVPMLPVNPMLLQLRALLSSASSPLLSSSPSSLSSLFTSTAASTSSSMTSASSLTSAYMSASSSSSPAPSTSPSSTVTSSPFATSSCRAAAEQSANSAPAFVNARACVAAAVALAAVLALA